MSNRIGLLTFAGMLLALSASSISALAGQSPADESAPPASQVFALNDEKDLTLMGVKAEPAEYNGRKAVRLTCGSGESGMALVKGTDFRDGTIEVDVATKLLTPPGVRMPGFTGIAFRSHSDGSRYELFYLRPKNALADDQAMRNHSVQYTSEPDFGWEKLRRQWPFIYEAYADIAPDVWVKVKIVVHGRQARLYLNGSSQPSLVVNGLKGEDLDGAIGLWSYEGEEAYFSNLRITNDKPEAIENGGDIAGSWDVKLATDAGPLGGTLKLVRQDSTVTGLFSGTLGPVQTVSGFWRNGYVELQFSGTWPNQPGSVTATLAGWVDGNGAGGRAKVEGRADGVWSASRSK